MSHLPHKTALLTVTLLAVLVVAAQATWSPNAPRSGSGMAEVTERADWILSMNPNWTVYRATGDSMHPYYGRNSLLIVDKVEPSAVREGMILIFLDHEGDVVGHLVARVASGVIHTRGAHTLSLDPHAVQPGSLIGVVVAVMHSNQPGPLASDQPSVIGKKY